MELDTSVRITYPGKEPMLFKSINEASDYTLELNKSDSWYKYLTVNAIKIRANNYAKLDKVIPKDNILCEWLNDKTVRHFRAKSSKRRGSNWEYKIRDRLKDIGFIHVVTSRGESKHKDNDNIDLIDLDNKLPVNIQAKSYKSAPDYNLIRQGCSDIDKPFIVAWQNSNVDDWFEARRNSDDIPIEKELFMVPAKFFYKLLEAYSKYYKIL